MDLVFEIGCEELPASFVDPALEQMRRAFIQKCDRRRIDADDVDTAGTPRRLALLVKGLADRQNDLEEERTGPPANIAYDDGEPNEKAKGFARGQGVDVDELYTVDTDRGEYVAAKVFEKGAETVELLPEILSEMIEGLDFPKSMRWGSRSETFGRPVRWLLAVADGEAVPVQFAGVESGRTTSGHRFSAPKPFEVGGVDDYLDRLEEADVTADPTTRRDQISSILKQRGEAVGGRVVDDPELIDEVVHLVESCRAVTLEFSDDYLELPREVLISSMRSHQRYFAVEKTDGNALLPACVVIYNTPVEDPAVVAEGNLKVLRARLDDARFFWNKDREQPLEDHRRKLENVVWLGGLGTIYDKTERLAELAEQIGALFGFDDKQRGFARRAALLSKADLVTDMVEEFPDLQGVMGREYALESGEDDAVAQAIEEHYLPKGSEGALPETDAGVCAAIADKLDAIVGCFGLEMEPTSGSDPHGLRRSAVGILRILRDRDSTAELAALVDASIDTYRSGDTTPFDLDAETIRANIVEFLSTRLRYLLEDDAPTDVVNAVLATEIRDIPSVYGRIEALADLRGEEDFEPLALGFKRVVNILQKQAEEYDLDALRVDPELLREPEEQELFEAATATRRAVADALADRRWDAACEQLIGLKEPVDDFFDTVMVMADDEELKQNRLAVLARLRDLFLQVADISEIRT